MNNMNNVEYDLSSTLIITKYTMDRLLKETDYEKLISLYLFYIYTATWQKTNQPKCTKSYVAKGLNWSEYKVESIKSKLIKMDLLENIKTVDEKNKISGWYVKVKYYTKPQNPTSGELKPTLKSWIPAKISHPPQNPTPWGICTQMLGTSKEQEMLNTNTAIPLEINTRITGTGLPENSVSNETEISSVNLENSLPVENNSITSACIKKVKRNNKVNTAFFDIPTEPELIVPNTITLTEKQIAIMEKRNNKVSKIKIVNPKVNINSLSDRIYSVINSKLITPLKELYKVDNDFDWINAAKLLRKTVNTDDRYTEFKIIVDQITDSEELNLLYHIITENNVLDSIKKDIIKKNESGEINSTTTISDKYFYSFIFKENPYKVHLNRIYKDYRLKLNNVIVQLEKETVKNELNNTDYKPQIGAY